MFDLLQVPYSDLGALPTEGALYGDESNGCQCHY